MPEALINADITCPYCFSELTTSVDLSAGGQDYYEDCQVCCNPMQLVIHIDYEGELSSIDVQPGND